MMNNPFERNPLEFPYCLHLIPGPGYSHARGFAWFENETAAISFLRDGQWCELFGPSISPKKYNTVSHSLDAINSFDPLSIQRLNTAADSIFELRWTGTFDALRSGRDHFAKSVWDDFINGVFPIPAESDDLLTDIDGFAEHLSNYRHHLAPDTTPKGSLS